MTRGRLGILVLGDRRASRVVPPTGFTAVLTVFAAAAMAFLAVFALALSLASGRLADRWAAELAGAATLRLPSDADTGLALDILSQTPGIASVRTLSEEEQIALLSPWFGSDLDLESLPVPQLIEIIAAEPPYDVQGLRLRLEAELPGSVLDDHGRWRVGLVEAADALRQMGRLALALILGATAAMIALAAHAALVANRQVIEVLRLVGARDGFIARAFIRRFTARAALGGILGSGFGMAAIAALPPASETGGFLTGLGFEGAGWMWPLTIPPICAAVGLVATWIAARRMLKELT